MPNTREIGLRRVEAELTTRGATSETVIVDGKGYLQVSASVQGGTILIKVKTKSKGNWQTNIDEANAVEIPFGIASMFWLCVSIEQPKTFWIIPDAWMRNDIHEADKAYLDAHGGHRARNNDSNHHSFTVQRVEEWENRWDILGIFR